MLKKIARAKAVSIMSFAAFLFVAAGAFWSRSALLGIVKSAPLILHFDDISGITAVGSSADLAFAALLGMAVVIINFFIALELDERNRFLGKFTATLTLIFAILLFLAFAAIINVN